MKPVPLPLGVRVGPKTIFVATGNEESDGQVHFDEYKAGRAFSHDRRRIEAILQSRDLALRPRW
jgi:hypothetical protein